MKGLAGILLYFILSVLIYAPLEGWSIADCIYYSVILLTTVGYGDLSPKHTLSRLVSCVFVIVGLTLVASQLGDCLDQLVQMEVKAQKSLIQRVLHSSSSDDEVGLLDAKAHRRRRAKRLLMSLTGVLVWVAFSMVVFKFSFQHAPGWWETLYFSVMTLTTVGTGDFVPHGNASKILVSVICLVGVPLFGRVLTQLAQLTYGTAKSDRLDQIVGGLTVDSLGCMQEFCRGLEQKGVYNPAREGGTKEISPFEFLSFMLVKNGVLETSDLAAVMNNFRELDVSGDGLLAEKDVELWARKRRGSLLLDVRDGDGLAAQVSSERGAASASSLQPVA